MPYALIIGAPGRVQLQNSAPGDWKDSHSRTLKKDTVGLGYSRGLGYHRGVK